MENNSELVLVEVPTVVAKPMRNNYEITMSNGFNTTLKRDVDFGMILKKDGSPISQRPTIFASGKDKILTGLGLTYLTEIVEHYCDFQQGFFYYMAKSTAYFDGKPVRTAYGSANTSEKSGGFASGFDLSNSACKKAVKRSEVALAIKLANLSDIFVGDLEDTNVEKMASQLQKDDDFINSKQIQRIFAIATSNGLTVEKAKQALKAMGYESTKSIKVKDYDTICEKIEQYAKENK